MTSVKRCQVNARILLTYSLENNFRGVKYCCVRVIRMAHIYFAPRHYGNCHGSKSTLRVDERVVSARKRDTYFII